MAQNKTINSISGRLILDKGDWSYITSAHFYSLEATINLTWKSLDPSIAQINPDSGLIYAKNTGETTVIGASNDETIMVLCSIKVQSKATETVTTATGASTTNVMPRCGGILSEEISSFGYSGTTFHYKIVGSRVTLEKGFGAKNGTSNVYSDLFRSLLVQMNNIYASMSPTQRGVWIALRLSGLISTIKDLLAGNYEDVAKDYIKDIIIQNALNLDELGSTVLGLRSWYEAEDNAVSYYEAF